MAHMHNVWFNEDNNIYQLANIPKLENNVQDDTESIERDGFSSIRKSKYESWKLISSFEADTLEDIVTEFQSISRFHQDLKE